MEFQIPSTPSDDWKMVVASPEPPSPRSPRSVSPQQIFANYAADPSSGADTRPGPSETHSPLDDDPDMTIAQPDLIPDVHITPDLPPAVEPSIVLSSFGPLLLNLESTVLVDAKEDEYDLIGDIKDTEWKSLQAYAGNVVELSVSDAPGQSPKIANSAFFRLGQHQGRTALFPSLSRLHITNTTSSSLFYLDMLFSPSLTTLTINNISSPSAVAFFLNRVGGEASLTTLILDSVNLSPDVSKAIPNYHHLEVLELNKLKEISPFSFKAIAHLPCLKLLKVDATDVTHLQTSTEFHHSGPKFQCLEELVFVGEASTLRVIVDDLASALCLQYMHIKLTKYTMFAIQRIAVKKKVLGRSAPGRPVQYSPVGDLLANISLRISLRYLVVVFNGNGDDDNALPGSVVSGLSSLLNLERLEISGVRITGLDQALSGTNQLWPKIQTLHLPVIDTSNKISSGLSLPTLQHIARSCSDLTSFQSSIILPNDHSLLTGFTEKPLSHPLKSLSVGSSAEAQWKYDSDNMDKVYHTATCLYAMFPDLDAIQTHEQYASEFWNEVHKLVKTYQNIRQLDRLRYSSTSNSLQDGHESVVDSNN